MEYLKTALEIAKNAAGAVLEIFRFKNKKLELNNSPEMQAADTAKKEVNEQDRIRKDVASGDAERQAKDIS